MYKKYEVIKTEKQLKKLKEQMLKIEEFAFDTETNTLKVYADNSDFKLVGISISWGEYNNYYIPTGHYFDTDQLSPTIVTKYLKPVFERKDVRIIGWNLKFDMHVVKRIGININTHDLIDVMVMSWLCDENKPKSLKEVTGLVLGIKQTKIDEVLNSVTTYEKKIAGLNAKQKATFDLARIDIASKYAVADAFYTWKLYTIFLTELGKEGMENNYYKVYPAFIYTLFNMEERGITVDVPKLKKMGEDMQKDLEQLEYEMLELAGVSINLSSTQQLVQLLYGYDGYKNNNEDILKVSFKFPITKTTESGAPQVNSDTLESIIKKEYKTKRKLEGIEFCKKLLEYKKLSKLKTAFVDGLLNEIYEDGKAHPSFNIVGTDSGRISCQSPNLQQLPNAGENDKYNIRDCFIGSIDQNTGKRKHIISVDYSNLEVRVMAHFSKDPALIQAFLDGKDLHGNTAKLMFRLDCDANEVKKLYPHLRQQGKVIAFLLQYGGSAYTLYEDLNKNGELDKLAIEQGKNKNSDFYGCKDGKEVAQRLMDIYFKAFKGIADFMVNQKKFAHRNGYILTLTGRKRRLKDINSNDYKLVSYLERLSINACIQGSGADIMINAQNKIDGTIIKAPMTSEYLKLKNLSPDQNFIGSERLKELGCEMLVQIHDEILLECPEENCDEAIDIIRDYMIHPFGENVKLNCPLEIGSGHSESYAGGH